MACNTGNCQIVDIPRQDLLCIGSPLSIILNYGSGATPWPGGRAYTECTLGFLAVEKATDTLVGITIGNLLNTNPTITQDRTDPENTLPTEIISNIYKYPFSFVYGKYSTVGSNMYIVGQTCNGNPLYSTPSSGPIVYNQVNAGMIYPSAYWTGSPTATVVTNNTQGFDPSWKLQPYNFTSITLTEAMTFATTAELNAITTSTEIFIAGFNQFKYADCGVKIDSVNTTYTFSFNNVPGTFPFNNLLSFTRRDPACGDPVMDKDVGATIAAYIAGKWKIIGIVIGFNGATGYGSRIDYIANELNIEAWDGTMKSFNSIQWNVIYNNDTAPVGFKTKPGLNTIKSFEENNTVYRQIGTSTLTLP